MPIEDKQKKKGKRENNLMKMFAKDSLVCQLQVAVVYIYMIYMISIGKVKI